MDFALEIYIFGYMMGTIQSILGAQVAGFARSRDHVHGVVGLLGQLYQHVPLIANLQ